MPTFLSSGIGRSCRIAFLVFTGAALLSACSDSNDSDDLVPVGPPLVCSDQPIDQPSVTCVLTIDTPEDYAEAVRNFETTPEHCISPDLYVTAGADPKGQLYAAGFQYAWANSSTNAHRYLEMNKKWGQGSDPSTLLKMITGIESFIGFPITIPAADAAYPITKDNVNNPPGAYPGSGTLQAAVYLLPDGVKAQVPSFESWFKILEQMGVFVPLELGQLMIEPYTKMSNDQDVVDVFTAMTGCEGDKSEYPERGWPSTAASPDDGTINKTCHSEVQKAFDFMVTTDDGPVKACKVGSCNSTPITSQQCFKGFNKNYLAPMLKGGMEHSALVGPLRAALAFCQDANPFNTGVGLGYNTAANPFACTSYANQSVSDRYTGREFIVKNYTLKELGYTDDSSNLKGARIVYFPPTTEASPGCTAKGGQWVFTLKKAQPPSKFPLVGSDACLFALKEKSGYDFLTKGYGFWD